MLINASAGLPDDIPRSRHVNQKKAYWKNFQE
jgi:hypothetical protein